MQDQVLEFSEVWRRGEGDVVVFNAFGLAQATSGEVLAFCEGRIDWRDDDPQHIFFKKSCDRGRTWSTNRILLEATHEVYHNPAPVVDRGSGSVFLFYGDSNLGESTRLVYLRSDDHGTTWSKPVDLTALFEDDPMGRTYHLPGPGHGIQMAGGRLTVPVWHRHGIFSRPLHDKTASPTATDHVYEPPSLEREYSASVVYSDDGGATWHNGEYSPVKDESGRFLAVNESRCAEVGDGRLLINARIGVAKQVDPTGPNRIVGISEDGGETWKPEWRRAFSASFPTDSPTVAYDADTLVFARPDCIWQSGKFDPGHGRHNMTVYVSTDQLQSYDHERVVDPGNSYYSDMCVLDDRTILLLYGRNFFNNWVGSQAQCARFNLAWATGD